MSRLVEFLKRAALEEGFDLCGIAPTAPLQELEGFPAWIAAGFHGEMDYMARTNRQGKLRRAALANIAPWARSAVVCATSYHTDTPYSIEVNDPNHAWVSRYAFLERDYHEILLPRLRKLEGRLYHRLAGGGAAVPRTWCYVDTGPIVERVLAQHSGIGWTGKNACILNQRLGSWMFLGVMLTSLELAPDAVAADRCGSCTLCLDACPTQSFLAPRVLDARRCISYLTIEQKSPVAPELREQVGRHLYGCDICQDVCPWNRKVPFSQTAAFSARTEIVNPPMHSISDMNEEEYWRAFRRTPVRSIKFEGFLRNAALAMGNSGDPAYLPRLRELAQHENPSVREHARWAVAKLETLGNGYCP
ncbi:MAG: tRNA epoxyqueuosine(34) reductase QueG [Acidobacteriota bacterium]|nr:tRNA epoxyqueuosine(34) reductase QueG [Acidobacteriota bacterium]